MKGRLSILELPDLINVSIEKIEARLDKVCQKYQNIIRLQDFIMNKTYIQDICEEINEIL